MASRSPSLENRLTFGGTSPSGVSFLCAVSGPGYANADMACRWLVDQGAELLLNVGVSGGLDPSLRSGDLVIAEQVIQVEDEKPRSWAPDTRCIEFLRECLSPTDAPVFFGPVECVNFPLLTPQTKKNHFQAYGTICVDMESAAVVRAAREMNVPCMVVRAVCDDARKNIPVQALDGITAQGGIDTLKLLRNMLGKPVLLYHLLGMNKDFKRAMERLRSVFQGRGDREDGVLFSAASAVMRDRRGS